MPGVRAWAHQPVVLRESLCVSVTEGPVMFKGRRWRCWSDHSITIFNIMMLLLFCFTMLILFYMKLTRNEWEKKHTKVKTNWKDYMFLTYDGTLFLLPSIFRTACKFTITLIPLACGNKQNAQEITCAELRSIKITWNNIILVGIGWYLKKTFPTEQHDFLKQNLTESTILKLLKRFCTW